ncbi:hypothetical protein, partial [Desulfosporosinus nitroreducens]
NPFVGVHAKASADAEGPISPRFTSCATQRLAKFLQHLTPVNGNVGERAISPDFHRPQRRTQDRPHVPLIPTPNRPER